MYTSAQAHGSGIIMLTTPDGKIYNVKVSNVNLEFNSDTDQYEVHTANGSVAVTHSTVHTTVDLRGSVTGMTVTDTKKVND